MKTVHLIKLLTEAIWKMLRDGELSHPVRVHNILSVLVTDLEPWIRTAELYMKDQDREED